MEIDGSLVALQDNSDTETDQDYNQSEAVDEPVFVRGSRGIQNIILF